MISDIEKHQIQNAIDREYVRSLQKWGNWDDMDILDMHFVIAKELREVEIAALNNDHHGEHGTLTELAHVAACVNKMMCQIIRREGMPDGLQ